MPFYDLDEYLTFTNNKNNIQTYFTDSNSKKGDVILINWIIYNDNNFVKYNNRSLNQRFTKPLYRSESNKFVKSIIKGNLNWNLWSYD